MSRSRKTPRPGGTRAESAPRSPTPASQNSTDVSGRGGLLRKLIFMIPLAFMVVLLLCTWMIASDARRSRQQQQRAVSNSLLAAQQLECIFRHESQRLAGKPQLSDPDRALLEAWVRYDERYALKNTEDVHTRYQQAMAHRRIGLATMMLDELNDAEDHFRQAIAFFGELARENQTVASYSSEQADTYARLAWVLHSNGKDSESREACSTALDLIKVAPLPGDVVFNAQAARTLTSLGNLACRRQQWEQARAHFAHAVALYHNLQDEYPGPDEYSAQLKHIEDLLNTMPPEDSSP